jgi:hypothetical protein
MRGCCKALAIALLTLAILVIEPSGSQPAKPNIPLLRMLVLQEAALPRFELLGREGTEAANTRRHFYNLSVHLPGGYSLWEVEQIDDAASVLTITYGETPSGFKQTVPAYGAPPDLKPGIEYYASAEGGVDPPSFILSGLGSAAFIYERH